VFVVRFFLQTVALALTQIRANKGRAFLTTLGVIIGVASVTAVIAALTGMKQFVLGEFESIGAKYVYIDGTVPRSMENSVSWFDVQLQTDEIEAIIEHATTIEKLNPHWRFNVEVRSGVEVLETVRGVGITTEWHDVEDRSVVLGRPFNGADDAGQLNVCLINDKAIEELHLDKDPIGEHIFIGGRRFAIVGVVETKAVSPMFGGGNAQSEVFVPFSTARKLNPRGWINDAGALLVSPDGAEDAKAEIRYILRKLRGLEPDEEDTFIVEVMQTYIDQFNSVAGGITAIAGGVVSISLLVGGVGIMNIMLVSVSERTREIGLRKAVGARPGVVLFQFLVEAVTLCVAGGLIGLVVGQLLTIAVQSIPGASLEEAFIPSWAIALAFAFSAGTGIVFGMFPAIKAARLDPIEALRHE
jgi:putative ABC transport system permease protein